MTRKRNEVKEDDVKRTDRPFWKKNLIITSKSTKGRGTLTLENGMRMVVAPTGIVSDTSHLRYLTTGIKSESQTMCRKIILLHSSKLIWFYLLCLCTIVLLHKDSGHAAVHS